MRSPNARRLLANLVLALTLTSLVASMVAGQTPSSAAAAPKVPIVLQNTAFDPQVTMVLVNQSVTWTNKDSFNHDVTAANKSWESDGGPGGMANGATFERAFDQAGVYDYYCTVHSTGPGNGMWGRVIVVNEPMLQLAGSGAGANPSKVGVHWLAHWVGIISFIAVFAVLIVYYFVLKYGETVHATDHRDRKEK